MTMDEYPENWLDRGLSHADRIHAADPQLARLVDRSVYAVGNFFTLSGTGTDAISEVDRVINTQACNDYLDLLARIQSGRGREAIRASRSLFELAVNRRFINAHPSRANRYLDYEPVGFPSDESSTQRLLGVNRLSGSERKSAQYQAHKLASQSSIQMARNEQQYSSVSRGGVTGVDLGLLLPAEQRGLGDSGLFAQLGHGFAVEHSLAQPAAVMRRVKRSKPHLLS